MTDTSLAPEASTQPEGQADTTAPVDSSSTASTEQTTQQDATTTEPAATETEAPPAPKAPETYEFKNPEGLPGEVAAEVHEAYSKAARELDLPQDQAQALYTETVDAIAKHAMKHTAELQQKQTDEWVKAAETDKEYGGKKFAENIGTARKALDEFGTQELRDLLFGPEGASTPQGQRWTGNHPELIRFLYRVGKAVSEDRFVAGRTGEVGAPDSEEAKNRRWYPNSP